MSRSKWKGPYINVKNINDILNVKKHHQNILEASRNSEIIPSFLGLTFNVYNGKNFMDVTVTNDMIGHKFGEFSFTRSKFTFKKKKSKR